MEVSNPIVGLGCLKYFFTHASLIFFVFISLGMYGARNDGASHEEELLVPPKEVFNQMRCKLSILISDYLSRV